MQESGQSSSFSLAFRFPRRGELVLLSFACMFSLVAASESSLLWLACFRTFSAIRPSFIAACAFANQHTWQVDM